MSDIAERQRQFEGCVDQFHAGLYRVAFRLTGRQAVAVELVQETYLQAWKGLASLRDPEKMRAWLFAILRRQYLKLMRRPGMILATDMSIVENGADADAGQWLENLGTVPSEVTNRERRDLIQWALDQLDEKYRFPVLLQLMEGLSVEEISTALELPAGTVLSQLSRGKQKLREVLERQLVDCPKEECE